MLREILVYFPYGILVAIAAILPILILIDAGGTAFQVGLLAALSAFCNLFGGFFWPKYLRIANKASLIVMGYLGMFLGLLLLQEPRLVFVATAIIAFFPRAIFYATISELKARSHALSGSLGKFYKFASIATAIGYVAGAVGTHFLSPIAFTKIVAFFALASVPLLAGTLSEESLGRLMGRGMNEFRRMGSQIANHRIRLTRVEFGRDKIPFLLTSAIFSLSFGLVFSQRANFVKTWRDSNFIVYALLFMEMMLSALIYDLAGKEDQKGLYIGHALLMVCLVSFLLAIHYLSLPWIVTAYLFAGLFWPFINIFYNSYGLGFSEELLGANLSARSLFYMIGSLIGGFLVEQYGFFVSFSAGAGIAVLAPLPFLIGRKYMNKDINAELQS
ncbi:MAG: MFS transporter [Candidatus Altiarchaeota archaeon]|nr:MFS transporter [Candidatus Altiarchaeota archaeon]